VLFFTDIGMEPRSYFLAFSRLAPVQCVTWGHPDTTGIDTLDHFISADACETADAAGHYSENLVRLKSFFLNDYAKPALSGAAKSAEHFGIKPGRNVYLCPQALFKLHPDFDDAMAAILRNDGGGEIVLLEGAHRVWGERLRKRLARTMPDVAGRVRFLPRLPWNDLLSAMTHADVVLDTFHFGGGNTTYEALAMGTPVVTLPAPYLRGRFTLGCYRQMEMTNCVADTPAAFVACANRLAQDKAWQADVRKRITTSVDTLFNQRRGIAELGDFFENALAAAPDMR
jgi:predicted O-linked N-acetylglucosamine transferase (SPINDLY family)